MLSAVTYLTLGALLARVQGGASAPLFMGLAIVMTLLVGHEPRLSRRPLAERRPGRLVRRARHGPPCAGSWRCSSSGGARWRSRARPPPRSRRLMMDDDRKPVRKTPRKVTPAYLQRAAMAYLERYASSAENLRRVLRRKVEKPAACVARTRDFHDAHRRGGVEKPARGTHRRHALCPGPGRDPAPPRRLGPGHPGEAVRQGHRPRHHRGALENEEGDEEGAARAFARRRKLGPYRPGERAPYRDKDMAAMARGGLPVRRGAKHHRRCRTRTFNLRRGRT